MCEACKGVRVQKLIKVCEGVREVCEVYKVREV